MKKEKAKKVEQTSDLKYIPAGAEIKITPIDSSEVFGAKAGVPRPTSYTESVFLDSSQK